MAIKIRKSRPGDVSAILSLIREFAAYEKLEHLLDTNEERLTDALFAVGSFVESLVAENEGHLVGYSLFYPNFASFRGQRGLYLEDIYISPKYRGSGAGQEMLKQIARSARSRGFERIDFLVLDWNEPAIRFYEKLGAVMDDTERHFKFTDSAFLDLAS